MPKNLIRRRSKPETYIDTIRPKFRCRGCGYIKPEDKGYLARKGIHGDPEMYCAECIKDFGLILEPEEKDRKT